MSDVSELIAFAHARLEEHEAAAHIAYHDPARVLREIAAKRALLNAFEEAERQHWDTIRRLENQTERTPLDQWTADTQDGWIAYGRWRGLYEAVRHLTAIWSDNTEYKPGWAP